MKQFFTYLFVTSLLMCFCVQPGYGQLKENLIVQFQNEGFKSKSLSNNKETDFYSILYSPTGMPIQKSVMATDFLTNEYIWQNNKWVYTERGYEKGRYPFTIPYLEYNIEKGWYYLYIPCGESGRQIYFALGSEKPTEKRNGWGALTAVETKNSRYEIAYDIFYGVSYLLTSIKYYLLSDKERDLHAEITYKYNEDKVSSFEYKSGAIIEYQEKDYYDEYKSLTKYEYYSATNSGVLQADVKEEFIYEFDKERNRFITITERKYTGINNNWILENYIINYPNSLNRDCTIANNGTIVDNKNTGSFDLILNISPEDVIKGIFTLTFPKGIQLDKENSKLFDYIDGLFTLKFTQQNDSIWNVEITPKTFRSESPILQQQITSWIQIAYITDKQLAKGYYHIKINDVAFDMTDGNTLFEPELKASVNVSRSPLSMEKITTSATMEIKDNSLYIQADHSGIVQIYTMNGLMLYNKRIEAGTTIIDINHLNQQILIVTTSYGLTKKFIR